MPSPADVWMVPLERGKVAETRGTLTLDDQGLSFVPRDGSYEVRIGMSTLRRARRVRGSPVLVVDHDAPGRRVQTAFYFTQPPPMPPRRQSPQPDPRSLGVVGVLRGRRNSKRRAMRGNANYLTTMNATKKPEIVSWVDEIRSRRSAMR